MKTIDEIEDIIYRLRELRIFSCTCNNTMLAEDAHSSDCPYKEKARELWDRESDTGPGNRGAKIGPGPVNDSKSRPN